MADVELQLITGHSRRTSLANYQHVAVDGQPAGRYQAEMKDVWAVGNIEIRRRSSASGQSIQLGRNPNPGSQAVIRRR
jgi:hypothetical protein